MTEVVGRSEQRRDAVRTMYGPAQAARYEETWQLSDVWRGESENHVTTIAGLLSEGDRWLDVGCGTGYFLSRFPGVSRAGIDLSPAMLDRARAHNPDALLFRVGDIAVDVPEWHGAWDLVTSTGQAWGYLPSMEDIEQAARNMVAWTAPGGTLLIQPSDIVDVTGHRIDYDFSGEPPVAGAVRVTGVLWSWFEHDAAHTDMLFPSLDVWVNWLVHDFEKVEIFHWPHDPPPPHLPIAPRVIVASGKWPQRSPTRAIVIAEPLPAPVAPEPDPAEQAELARLEAERRAEEARIERERNEAIAANDAAWELLQAQADRMQARAETAEAAVAWLESGRAERPDPTLPSGRLVDLPLSTLVARYAPWRPRFWRGVARRINRLRSS